MTARTVPRKVRCIRCSETWKISALAVVPIGGYVCPDCAKRRSVKMLEKAREVVTA